MVDYEFTRYIIENDFTLSPDHPYMIGVPIVSSPISDLKITVEGGDIPKVTSPRQKKLKKKVASSPISDSTSSPSFPHAESPTPSSLQKIVSCYSSSNHSFDKMVEEGYQAVKVADTRDSPFYQRDSLIQEEHYSLSLSLIHAASDDSVFFDSLILEHDDIMIGDSHGNFISAALDVESEVVKTGVEVPMNEVPTVFAKEFVHMVEDNGAIIVESVDNDSPIMQISSNFIAVISSLLSHLA